MLVCSVQTPTANLRRVTNTSFSHLASSVRTGRKPNRVVLVGLCASDFDHCDIGIKQPKTDIMFSFR